MPSLINPVATALLASVCALTPPAVSAQSTTPATPAYPAKPITLILPQIAGGVSDVIMRRVAQKMSGWAKPSSSRTGPVRAATSARRWRSRPRPTATRY